MASRKLTPIEEPLRRAMVRVGADRGHCVHDHTRAVLADEIDFCSVPGKYRRMDVRKVGAEWPIGFTPYPWIEIHRELDSFEFGIAIFPQVRVDQYRVDFIVMASGNASLLAIECDGHDWHERTKQQAASDRARDRHLLRFGISTIRFTGSEIFHDAEQCAGEVIDTLRAVRDANDRDDQRAVEYHEAQQRIGREHDADVIAYQAEKAMRAAGWPAPWPNEEI